MLLMAVDRASAADHCVILQYQFISEETPGIASITPDLFQSHLDHLLTRDHVVLPLAEVVDALKHREPLAERCVALTIDGSHESAYTEAFPRTRRYEFPLTVFIDTAAIDADAPGHLNWDQVREMHEAGVSFQNHSHTLNHLIRRQDDESVADWEQRVAVDILKAQNRIQSELGATPTSFAYPFGEYNGALQSIVRSMGLDAFARQPGPVWGTADLGALPRFAMVSIGARMRTFENKVNSLPLPITGAFPTDPVVAINEWRPSLTLVFRPGIDGLERLRCYLNGSPEVTYAWLDQPEGAVVIRPKGRLRPGLNRTHCILPVDDTGQDAWYSHNWIRRQPDGRWQD
jgi:peptidoglycan/xylan/chitin deacetylase (PgdA/CDA1 family)